MRIMAGIIVLVAGWTTIVPGLGGFTGFMAQLGFPAPAVLAPFIALLELIGGFLLLIGLETRWLGLLFLVEFIVTSDVIRGQTAMAGLGC